MEKQTTCEFTGRIPTGKELLEKMIELFAEQNGVIIKAEIEEVKKTA